MINRNTVNNNTSIPKDQPTEGHQLFNLTAPRRCSKNHHKSTPSHIKQKNRLSHQEKGQS